MFGVNMTFISSSEVKKCIFHECRRHEWNIHYFTSRDEIKVIFTTNIWIFFLLYTSLSTINVNKKKSSYRSYIFHCSEEWKYKFYIFTSENITFSKYAFYFINNSLYFITLYIMKGIIDFLRYCKNELGQIKQNKKIDKMCVFRVTLSYLIFLANSNNCFHVYLKKEVTYYWDKIYLCY